MTDNNDSFLKEVEDELSREKYQQLWDRYGTYAIAAVVALVGGVAGFQYYRSSSLAAAEAAGASYLEAQAESEAEGASIGARVAAANAFKELAKDGPVGYASLAQLQLAGARLESGKTDEALEIFEALSERPGADPLLRDFAALQAASLRVGDADFTEMQNRLTPLTEDGNAWRFSARQLMGIAAAKVGKNDVARSYFERLLGDPDTPQSVRQRANLFMTQVALADQDKEPSESPSTTDEPKKTSEGEKQTESGTSKTGSSNAAEDKKKKDEVSSEETKK